MNILFVSFGELSLGAGAVRSISVLRALADAGHDVDVVAADARIARHPNISILCGEGEKRLPKSRLKAVIGKALRKKSYHIVHAVDDSVLSISRITRWRKVKVVYEASRCFSGPNGVAPSWLWKIFPTHYGRIEKSVLRRSALVLTASETLSADIGNLEREARIVHVEPIAENPLLPRKDVDRASLLARFDVPATGVVVCCVLPGNRNELRMLLLATRKVLEAMPRVVFFFRGLAGKEAESMAVNLDIRNRCVFLDPHSLEDYLAALTIADAVLFVPEPSGRYVNPAVLTLLHSPAPLVAVQGGAYARLLTEQNSIQVVSSAESIAEGVLRIFQEPLLSFALAIEGQQLVADHHSFSSFKHKIRMTYHEL